MIDAHSHILPGVDDGAKTLDDSLAMARLAVEGGTTDMVCTSHSAEWFEIGPLAVMQAQVDALQAALREADIPLTLWAGMEIFLTPDTPRHLAAGRAWTLAGSQYVLVEVPYDPWMTYTEQTLFTLQVKGYTPILAHPERYVAIQRDPNLMYRMAERGVLGQVTTGAFHGAFGESTRRCALTLVAHGLVQILASDTHSATDRRRLPGLSAGVDALTPLIGADLATRMAGDLPGHILTNTPMPTDPRPVAPPRSVFSRLFDRG
ncbi:MAG TPA: CpsB/CapC family capsule biosynthesis tyrosine phosphatase [Chloroflexia bacterium]|nr:CpsB/CapC family capsule biosynthesis tyrosine phosphatase [Chloroflexia bacterium]